MPPLEDAPVTSPLVQWAQWLVFLLAPLGYAVVAFVVRHEPPGVSLPDFGRPLDLAFTALALGSAAAGFVVPRFVAARPASARAVAFVVRCALFEAVAIYGLVLVLVGDPASRVVPFAALAFALLAASPPRPADETGNLPR